MREKEGESGVLEALARGGRSSAILTANRKSARILPCRLPQHFFFASPFHSDDSESRLRLWLPCEQVMPTVMSPKAGEVNRLSQCIPPSMPSLEEGQSPLRSPMHSHLGVTTNRAVPAWTGERNGDKGETSCSTGAVVGGIEHILQTVPTSSAVIVYGFNPVDRVVKGLAAARGFPVDASAAAVAGDVDDRRKCVLIRATAEVAAADDSADVAGETSRRDTSRGGFGEALGAGLSRPILAEEMGETHLWVMDSRGRRHLAAAFVSLQRATIFLTISASGQFPPFRIENRSSAETLAYRQVCRVIVEVVRWGFF